MLVLAGPGSGKTYVLTAHIEALLAEHHVSPSSILVLTFSKAAAISMRSRFYKSTEGRYPPISFGTFHSIFYQIIRMAGQNKTAVIAPARRQGLLAGILRQYFPELSLEEDLDLLSAVIGRSREQGCPVPQGDVRDLARIRDAVRMYESYLAENRLIDYDGMILECRDLLRRDPALLRAIQTQYSYILVDEFQDISHVQYEILRLLYDRNGDAPRALFVVGDDDQSIYGFRGADPAICRDFLRDYPQARQILLQVNYRSLAPIVTSAGLVIEENHNRIAKKVIAGRRDPQAVRNVVREAAAYEARPRVVAVQAFADRQRQIDYLVQLIAGMDERTRRESAIICRTNRQLRQLRHACVRAGLLSAGHDGNENPWVARVRSLYADYMAFGRQIREDRIERETYARIRNVPERYLLLESMPRDVMTRREFELVYAADSPAGKTMRQMAEMAAVLCDLTPAHRVRYFRYVIGIEEALIARANHSPEQTAAIQAALAELQAHPEETGRSDLTYSAQKTSAAQPEEIGIALLTMHASKGLEFRNVYLPDLNEGIVPPRRAHTDEAVEEERRLFYVAMTRARDHLELLYVKGTEENPCMPTRFLLPLGIGPSY